MWAGRKTQSFNMGGTLPISPNPGCGRYLGKYQLGGVIFGCKNRTIKECQSKQLFGLPAQHFSYVKNIDPGLPLFLFNYSDRMLHGIFEASSKGQMYIDPYAWIDHYSELDRTQFPAQVKIRVRLQCEPLPEEKFVQVIGDNYYSNNHFWFELDHKQTNKLMSLLVSLAFAPGCNMKWSTISPSNPPTLKEGEAFETPESEAKHSSSSSKITDSNEIASSLDGDIKPLDTQAMLKEVDENEINLVFMKLKELALGYENQGLSMSDNVKDTTDENDLCIVEEGYLDVPAGLEYKEESSSPPVEHENTIDQLMQEVEELTASSKIQTQKNCYLEQKLMEAELEIQHLKDHCKIFESAFNLPLTHVKRHEDHKESLFSTEGFDGESWLSTMDLYCPSRNVIKSLYAMNSVHSYASIVHLNGELYVFSGVNPEFDPSNSVSYSPIPIFNKWSLSPSLNKNKESLTVISLTNKIFAVDGANGIDCYLDVDLDIGRWITTQSMLDKRFTPDAVELNGWPYATSGYNGIGYLKEDFMISACTIHL